MFKNVLEADTKNFLMGIKKEDLPKSSYLAGGTAIALQIGHRKSFDLDFFTKSEFNEIQWEQKFIKIWDFHTLQRDWQTITGQIKDIKLSIFYYKYKLIDKPTKFGSNFIASLADLAAMKLDTVISRGTKRDFIDIYFLAKKFGLTKLFEFYQEKYRNFEEREIMIKKSLIYFKEADKDEMPNMLVNIKWNDVKNFFLTSPALQI